MKRKDYYFLTIIRPDFTSYLKECGIDNFEIVTYQGVESGKFDCPGVWALFGVDKRDKQWRCLQVGQTTRSMSKEIIKDIRIMKKKKIDLERPYVNKWGEEVFRHPTHFQTAGMWAYTDIPKKYNQFKWIVISREKSRDKQKEIEKKFAEAHQAVYWREGRAS